MRATTVFMIVFAATTMVGGCIFVATSANDWSSGAEEAMLLCLFGAWVLSLVGLICESTEDNVHSYPEAALAAEGLHKAWLSEQDRAERDAQAELDKHTDILSLSTAEFNAWYERVMSAPEPAASTITVQGPLRTGTYIVGEGSPIAYIITADEYEAWTAFNEVRDRLAQLDYDCNHD